MNATIIKTATGAEYRRMEFTDSWGRVRVCDRRLDSLPQPHADACACCGQPIQHERSTGKYCSPACKQRAYRQRKAVNEPAV